jgi:hypothetical protein
MPKFQSGAQNVRAAAKAVGAAAAAAAPAAPAAAAAPAAPAAAAAAAAAATSDAETEPETEPESDADDADGALSGSSGALAGSVPRPSLRALRRARVPAAFPNFADAAAAFSMAPVARAVLIHGITSLVDDASAEPATAGGAAAWLPAPPGGAGPIAAPRRAARALPASAAPRAAGTRATEALCFRLVKFALDGGAGALWKPGDLVDALSVCDAASALADVAVAAADVPLADVLAEVLFARVAPRDGLSFYLVVVAREDAVAVVTVPCTVSASSPTSPWSRRLARRCKGAASGELDGTRFMLPIVPQDADDAMRILERYGDAPAGLARALAERAQSRVLAAAPVRAAGAGRIFGADAVPVSVALARCVGIDMVNLVVAGGDDRDGVLAALVAGEAVDVAEGALPAFLRAAGAPGAVDNPTSRAARDFLASGMAAAAAATAARGGAPAPQSACVAVVAASEEAIAAAARAAPPMTLAGLAGDAPTLTPASPDFAGRVANVRAALPLYAHPRAVSVLGELVPPIC